MVEWEIGRLQNTFTNKAKSKLILFKILKNNEKTKINYIIVKYSPLSLPSDNKKLEKN